MMLSRDDEARLWSELDPHSYRNKLRRYGTGGEVAPAPRSKLKVSAWEACKTEDCLGDLYRTPTGLRCRLCGGGPWS